ncbi:MAG: hypothetical protein ACRER8_18310 [Pseudomonas sp.]|uniref:hypothetical protein n=1 Tax=Pseudomonas sp. TaxID=306 RepID=UPI003D700223
MKTFKEQRACRAERAGSTVPSTVFVARITPCRYSVRQAIHRYRHIQQDDGSDVSSTILKVLG